eukprot:5700497-Prorocentrum_lima.AAC.1
MSSIRVPGTRRPRLWPIDQQKHCLEVYKIWINPFGPPGIIETDQDGGLISEDSKKYLSQIGTELKEKG